MRHFKFSSALLKRFNALVEEAAMGKDWNKYTKNK
jgi:hypothetical protein